MSISKTLYPLLRTGSTQEDRSGHDRKIVDWDVKNQNKQCNLQVHSELAHSIRVTPKCLLWQTVNNLKKESFRNRENLLY